MKEKWKWRLFLLFAATCAAISLTVIAVSGGFIVFMSNEVWGLSFFFLTVWLFVLFFGTIVRLKNTSRDFDRLFSAVRLIITKNQHPLSRDLGANIEHLEEIVQEGNDDHTRFVNAGEEMAGLDEQLVRVQKTLPADTRIERVRALVNRHLELRDVCLAANSLAITAVVKVVTPIWQTHGKRFELEPAVARDMRRVIGAAVLSFLSKMPDTKIVDVVELFGEKQKLLEDTLARAVKTEAVDPLGQFYRDLMEVLSAMRMGCLVEAAETETESSASVETPDPVTPPTADQPQVGDTYRRLFHAAWTACIYRSDYDKKIWKDCQRQLEAALNLRPQNTGASPDGLTDKLDVVKVFVSSVGSAAGFDFLSWELAKLQLAAASATDTPAPNAPATGS